MEININEHKDKVAGKEKVRQKDHSPVSDSKTLFSSYLTPKARVIYNNVSDIKNKLELLEEMINIKFSNLIASQDSINLADTSQSNVDSIAHRTLTNMIRDYYKIKSETQDINEELSKVDLILQEIQAQAWADTEGND